MAAPPISVEQQLSAYGLEPYLPPVDWQELQARDESMIAELHRLNQLSPAVHSPATGLDFACGELAELARADYDATSLTDLEQFLTDHGTLDILIVDGYTVTVDGISHDVRLVAATETTTNGANHGEMSSMLYLRDQIQAADALIKLALADPDHYSQEGKLGKELLISALHLLSTADQLARFDDVIQRGPEAGQADWPHISLYFDDLDGTKPNGWRNKQDSWQMLAYTTLDVIEKGFLKPNELAQAHKQFLASAVPFLVSAGYPRYANSGSWEEIEAAPRTSVLAIETALLFKIQSLAEQNEQLSFLTDHPLLEDIAREGLCELGMRLPYESSGYDQTSVRYRQGDATLAYVLRYNLPQLLAENQIPMAANDGQPMSAEAIEDLVLAQLAQLIDPHTNGIIRYENDSYQRLNFHTGVVQLIIKTIKRKVQHDAQQNGDEIDLDLKQRLRNELTPPGQPAAWTHPLGQIASWAAGRSRDATAIGNHEEAARYRTISQRFLNAILSTVTGSDQWQATLDEHGQYQIRQVPAHKLTECYVTYQTSDGESFRVPSPHTPLNWSTAMLKESIGMLRSACT